MAKGNQSTLGKLIFTLIIMSILSSGFVCIFKIFSRYIVKKLYKHKIYIVARGSGPIPYAYGNIFIQAIILEGKDSRKWTKREKANIPKLCEKAFEWTEEWANRYGKDLKISYNVWDLSKFKCFHKIYVPLFYKEKSDRYNIIEWINQVARIKLSKDSDIYDLYEFLNRENTYSGVGIMLFFPPPRKYSFAQRSFGNGGYPEFVVIHHEDPYVIAHEFLHMPGADDLYNKKIDKNFCLNDIFNKWTIRPPVVCSLTAFAVGWIDKLPSHDGLIIEDKSSEADKQKRRLKNE